MNTPSPYQSGNWFIITPSLRIPMGAIQIDACLSSGPGGQNVNKTASAVQLNFDLDLAHLPPHVEKRLLSRKGFTLTRDRVVCIRASRYRSQLANKRDAFERLEHLLRAALIRPRPRKATKATKASVERRLKRKKIQSLRKKRRNSPDRDDG